MMDDYVTIDNLISSLEALDASGSRTLANGTRLIRKNEPREIGDMQYLHGIYAGLDEQQIQALESGIRRPLPKSLHSFYGRANGLFLFSKSLSIQGMRFDCSRQPDDSAWQPVSLENKNVLERPTNIDPDIVFFGFYSDDGGYVYTRSSHDARIIAVPQRSMTPSLYSWPNLESFLLSECERMTQLYKQRGGKVTALNPLPPPWGG